MNRFKLVLGAALGCAVSLVSAQDMREISFYVAMPAGESPKIDGALDDACWKSAVPHTYYYEYVHINPNNPRRVDCPTECRVVYDAKGVYCGVRNWEDLPEKMARSVTKSNQGQGLTWNDCAEIYFDPDANGVGYYKFAVNANGCYDLLWRMDAANAHEGYRVPGVQTAAKVFKDRWELELFVPWSSFHGRPGAKAGDIWTFNHCRFRFTHGCFFCTSSPGGSNYTPEKFGYLYFTDGTKPDPAKVCDVISQRLSTQWGIKIGEDVFVHDVKGTHRTNLDELKSASESQYRALAKTAEPRLAEPDNKRLQKDFDKLQVRFTNEIARYDSSFAAAQAFDDLVVKMKEINYLVAMTDLGSAGYTGEKIELPYGGSYDFSEPKAYRGYDGWYRHNRPKDGYRTPHQEWLPKTAERPRVCFMSEEGGSFRECCEIADRFDLEAWYMPCVFGGSGVYADAVSLGRPMDKYRQFESILMKNPDVFYVATGWPRYRWDEWVPARYRYELMRRVADEGKGLVFACELPNSIRSSLLKLGLDRNRRGPGSFKFGKGVITWLEAGAPPAWSLEWRHRYEARMARCWNAIRGAQGKAPLATVEFANGQASDELPATSRYLPFRIGNDGADEALVRVRDIFGRTVDRKTVKLAKGANDLSVETAALADGEYALDVIPRAKGAGDFVTTHPFTKASLLGTVVLDGTNLSWIAENQSRWIVLQWENGLPETANLEWEVRDLPYGQVRRKGVAGPVRRGERRSNVLQLKNDNFPTLAAEIRVRIVTTDGRVLGQARKPVSLPHHRFPDYTLISWDGPDHNRMGELYQPVMCETLGYRAGLGCDGLTGAALNFAPVAQHAHVRILNQGSNTFWKTFRGFNTPWGKVPEIDAMGKEITPNDPMCKELLERYYGAYVKEQVRFGTTCWNLGDECSFSYGGGYGPKDRAAYCAFIQKRYGTVEKYNRIHGTSIKDFSETPHRLVKELLEAQDYAGYVDHCAFMEQTYADAYQLFHTIVKKVDPKARVGAEGSNPGDLELTVRNLEFWGPYRSLVDDELLREIAPQTLRGIWWGGYFNNLRDGFPLQQWEFVLTGTLNSDLWFQGAPGSTQGYAGGDMTVAPYMAKMQPHLKPLRRGIGSLLVKTPFRKDGAGLWFSHPSKVVSSHSDCFSAAGDTAAAFVQFCYRHGYSVNFVTPRRLEWLKDKRLVFLPGVVAMSDEECAALLDWVKKGGVVVSDFTPAVLDGYGAGRAKNPLAELFGDVTLKDLQPIDTSAKLDFAETVEFGGKKFSFALKGDQFASMPGVKPFRWKAFGKGGAVRLNFTLSSARISAGDAAYDAFVQTLFDLKGIRIAESVGGISPVFRVRELNGMRLAGFKTNTKDLGKRVTVDFGSEGFVYEVDRGFVGKTAKVELAKLDCPFKLYSSFASEQVAPPVPVAARAAAGDTLTVATDALRKGSVYRLTVRDPKGREIEHRAVVFTADGKALKLQFPYDDEPGIWTVALRDIATGLEGTAKVKLLKPLVKPSQAHLDYLKRGVIGLIHYGLNTYTDQEWGYGDADPKLFNPKNLDAAQWVKAAKAGGLKCLVLVAKHHDGFCLWPSALNKDYSVANSPWKDGKGNVVKDLRDACQKAGLGFGVYLSPWDRHQAEYARPAYVDYFHGQWDDLLANYGPISEIWLDGANGGDGWYGGAKEKRTIPKDYYKLLWLQEKLRRSHPLAVAFGGRGANCVHFCGNESGFNAETCRHDRGEFWNPPEADTPFRHGWFWHPYDTPKSLKALVGIYFNCVGRNAVLDLGLAPNRDGLLGDDDVKRLQEFGDYVRAFESKDLAQGARWERSVDGRTVTLVTKGEVAFNAVDLGENIENGQRVDAFRVEAKVGDGWKEIAKATTIGYRRILKLDAEVRASAVRLAVTDAIGDPELVSFKLRLAPDVPQEHAVKGLDYHPADALSVAVPEDASLVNIGSTSGDLTTSGFTYVPPKSGKGLMDRYSVDVVENWAKGWRRVKEGEFGNMKANPIPQTVRFDKPVTCKRIRIVAARGLDGTPRLTAEQIDLIK